MFIQPVLRIVAKHYVQKYLPESWVCGFTCGQVAVKKNAIILQNAHISLSTNIHHLSTEITVDAIEIQFRPFMRIYCVHPLVVCAKSPRIDKPDVTVTYKNHVAALPWGLEIENGELHVKDDNKIDKFSFTLATPHRDAGGIISISMPGEDPCVVANYLYKQNRIVGNLSCKEVNLDRFYSLFTIFFPLEATQVTGSTTGFLSFGEELSGKIICSNFTYTRKNFPIQISCQKCDISIAEKDSLPIISSTVKEGAVFLSREEEGSSIAIQNICGQIGINDVTQISANLQVGEHILPCALQGEGNKGEILFGNDSPQKISYLTSREMDGVLLSLDLNRIVGAPLLTIQYALGQLYPELEPFLLESGTIDGRCQYFGICGMWKGLYVIDYL